MNDYSTLRKQLMESPSPGWQLAGYGPTILAALDALEDERIARETAEAFALKHGAYQLKGSGPWWRECQGCGRQCTGGSSGLMVHKPGCYVAELERRQEAN